MSSTPDITVSGSGHVTNVILNSSSAEIGAASVESATLPAAVSQHIQKIGIYVEESSLQLPGTENGVSDAVFKAGRSGSVLYYALGNMDLAANIGGILVAYDTSSDSVLWHRAGQQPPTNNAQLADTNYLHSKDITWGAPKTPYVSARTFGAMRNTPFIDEKGLVWVHNGDDGTAVISAFDSLTGVPQYEISLHERADWPSGTGNRFNPNSPYGQGIQMVRTGIKVEYEGNVPKLYFGITGSADYWYINLFQQDDWTLPGTLGNTGYLCKFDPVANVYDWKLDSNPVEILPNSGVIPDACFPPNQDELYVEVALADGIERGHAIKFGEPMAGGLVLDVSQSLAIAPNLNPFAPTQLYDVVFPVGDFSANANVDILDASGNVHSTMTGADLMNVYNRLDGSGNFVEWIPQMVKGKVTKSFDFNVDLSFADQANRYHPHAYIAYQLNYYGAGLWCNDVCEFSGNYVITGFGNQSHAPLSTHKRLQELDLLTRPQDTKLDQDLMTIAEYKVKVKECLEKPLADKLLSPRDLRAFGMSMVVVNKADGKPVSVIKGDAYDTWNFADIGGFGGFGGAPPQFGQPNGKPLQITQGNDGDVGAKPVLQGNNIASFTKAGYGFFSNLDALASGPLTDSVLGDTSPGLDQGISGELLNIPRTVVVAGLVGGGGGVNYEICASENTVFVALCNLANIWTPFVVGTRPDWESDVPGIIVKNSAAYVSAYNMTDGSFKWISSMGDETAAYCQVTLGDDGRVWSYPRNSARLSTGALALKVLGFNKDTGIIEREIIPKPDGATTRTDADAIYVAGKPPEVVGDKLYLIPFVGSFGAPNVLVPDCKLYKYNLH